MKKYFKLIICAMLVLLSISSVGAKEKPQYLLTDKYVIIDYNKYDIVDNKICF